jgi:glycerophosphoryl diester phosphodiesterase
MQPGGGGTGKDAPRARPLLVAHRGLSGTRPENTAVAFRDALALGADVVELDVHLSKDGHVVVLHDATVDRTCKGASGPVAGFTAAELRALDAGSHKGPQFAGEPVPLLDEVLPLFVSDKSNPGRRCKVLIELKFVTWSWQRGLFAKYDGLERKVVELVQAHSAHDVVVVHSFLEDYLRTIAQLDPKIELHLLVFPWRSHASVLAFPHCVSLNPGLRYVSPAFVARAKQAGRKVFVWTVNTKEGVEYAMHCGVDGIITDRLAEAREYAAGFSPHTYAGPPASLLQQLAPVAAALLVLAIAVYHGVAAHGESA